MIELTVYHQMLNCLLIFNFGKPQHESNDGLCKINNRAFQWKMSFSLDQSKQALEITFTRKTKEISPFVTF